LLTQIEAFEKKHKLNLLRRLRTEVNEARFLAMITEIQFGLFFDKIANSLKYEQPIDNKTPDWTIGMNGQEIITEVVRLNPSAADKDELDFEDNFMDSLEKISIGCLLHFGYDPKTINRKQIDISKCREIIENWLAPPRNIGDKILLFNSIEVKLIELNSSVLHVCLVGGCGQINFDYRRLTSENSTLALKARKYANMIEKSKLAYIICLYMDFHT
jgi:hypothetical protein